MRLIATELILIGRSSGSRRPLYSNAVRMSITMWHSSLQAWRIRRKSSMLAIIISSETRSVRVLRPRRTFDNSIPKVLESLNWMTILALLDHVVSGRAISTLRRCWRPTWVRRRWKRKRSIQHVFAQELESVVSVEQCGRFFTNGPTDAQKARIDG